MDVKPLLFSYLAIAVARSLFTWAEEIFAQRLASSVKIDLRATLTEHLQALGPGYVRGERTGELTHTIVGGVESLDAYLAQYLPRLARAAILPVVLLAFILPSDAISGVIMLVTAPLIPLFVVLIGSMAKARTRRQWLTLSRMSARFLDLLQGLETLKLLGRSREAEETIRRASEQFQQATMAVLKVAFLSSLVLEMTATVSTALVAVGVGLRLLSGGLDFQDALFVLILTPEFYRPLRDLGGAFHAGLPGAEASKRIFAILETRSTALPCGEGKAVSCIEPCDIEFDDVRFRYEPGRRPALDGVSFRVPAGQKVALVGPIGAGKSTVAHLLLGFGVPDRGVIRVGEKSLRHLDCSSWRRNLAWVSQQPHLFHGTVGENIQLARREASHADIVEAARMAQAHGFIEALPRGYDTPLGEGAARLSGGQAQRVALARAFLRDAPVLILDEPTSQLDPEHEARIQEAIRRLMKGRTVVLIAHRLNTVFDADRIILLSDGKVAEQGTHATLLEEGRLYPRLVEAYGGLS